MEQNPFHVGGKGTLFKVLNRLTVNSFYNTCRPKCCCDQKSPCGITNRNERLTDKNFKTQTRAKVSKVITAAEN